MTAKQVHQLEQMLLEAHLTVVDGRSNSQHLAINIKMLVTVGLRKKQIKRTASISSNRSLHLSKGKTTERA